MRKHTLRDQSGFTLMEILIVVILLGILAMVVVPQITISSEDTKVSTLQSNLSQLRSLLEIYYAQHGETYPGVIDDSDGVGPPTNAATALDLMYGPSVKLALSDVDDSPDGLVYRVS